MDVFIKHKKLKAPAANACLYDKIHDWIDIPSKSVKDTVESISGCLIKPVLDKNVSNAIAKKA